jgi:hypothetical protein
VTTRWFNDVWMKEAMANFMASKIVNPSFPEINHDLRFLLSHSPSAYGVDRTGGALRAGHELFFETLDSHTMAAAYTVRDDSFVVDKPRLWSEKLIGGVVGNVKNIDLAPDGKRIVALMPAESKGAQEAQNHVVFVENFFDQLRRKVPTGK